MDYNFDCTQFITFNGNLMDNDLIKIYKLFENIGFEINSDVVELKTKLDYFKDYACDYFIEIKNDNFLSIIENWIIKENSPDNVLKFIDLINYVLTNFSISNLRIILCIFAEPGTTKNEFKKIKQIGILDSLFELSLYNYSNIPDNLILEISK